MSSNPPGLNRGDKIDKPANPDKPGKPSDPGTEDKSDRKAQKGEHIYTYDCLNRMVSSSIAGTFTSYTYDTLGNLTLETVKNKSVDYIYNELNQLVRKTTSTNDVYTYSYDGRGNRVAEIGPKASQEFVFDATNRMVSGTNWKGDESAYTYNGLGIRVNNTHTTHAGQVYERDYVIDYTSYENDDLYVYATGNGQLEYEQLHVYAGSERIEQFTARGNGNWERTLYVHEDVMGNTRYYTKTNGQSFAELEYDAWGMPVSPNKLLNNDHGNYVFATFTGHIYDTTLDMYFAEARFYDAGNRQWLSMDPVKDGLNWYLYCGANPTTYWDPTGLRTSKFNKFVGSGSLLEDTWAKLLEKVPHPEVLDEQRRTENTGLWQTLGDWWNEHKVGVAKVAVAGVGMAASITLNALTGGTMMPIIGAGVGAVQNALNSIIDQMSSTGRVDWGTVGHESLKGGVIGAISGGIGGYFAGLTGPLHFCGQSAMQIVGQIGSKWLAGTMGSGLTGMAATYVSDRMDGYSHAQSTQNVMDNLGNIWGAAALTSAVNVAIQSAVAPVCFVAGTAVLTANGLVAIENIRAGDTVVAKDEETGEIAVKQVVRTFENSTEELTHVTIRTESGTLETIDTTPQHPFYVEGKGWVEASALHIGMTVWLADGTKATVEDVSSETLDEAIAVYNFEVEDFHTYFVGHSGVWVHNACEQPGERPSSAQLRQNLIESGVDEPPYPNAAHHIVAGSASEAAQTRIILENFDIGINDAANGVFLPTQQGVTSAAYHPSLHTNTYYSAVQQTLSVADSKETAIELLQNIASELLAGEFPH